MNSNVNQEIIGLKRVVLTKEGSNINQELEERIISIRWHTRSISDETKNVHDG